MLVSAVQVASTDVPQDNLTQLASWTRGAAERGARVVVFPEASQHCFGPSGPGVAQGAEALDGPFVTGLVELSDRFGVVLVAGMFERHPSGGAPFNTTVVTSPEGRLGEYRKIHLYDALGFHESAGVSPGPVSEENMCLFDVGGMRIGVLTCFDLRFPEMAQALVARGANTLILGAAWVPGPFKPAQWRTLLTARALDSVSYVIGAAQPAPRYCGRTSIVAPSGEVICSRPGGGEGLVVADLSVETLRAARQSLPIPALRRLKGDFLE